MSNDNRRTRTLLPRTTAPDNYPITNPDPGSSTGATRSAHAPPYRTNNRSACLACRKRRSKCSGGNPCSGCRLRETECVYNEFDDKRRRESKLANNRELGLYKKVYLGLQRALREDKGQELVGLIRDLAPLEALVLMIDNMYPDMTNEIVLGTAQERWLPALQQVAQQREGETEGSGPLNTVTMPTQDQPNSDVPGISHGLAEAGNVFPGQSFSSIAGTGATPYIRPPFRRQVETDFDLGKLYINFRDSARLLIRQGVPRIKILGDSSVSCSWLLNADRPDRHLPFGVTGWATNVVNSVANVDILFRLAWLCYLIRFIRWAVDPTETHFQGLPHAMRFTSMQSAGEHDPLIDLIPIPQIRDAMLVHFRDFPSALGQSGASVYWTDSFDDAFDEDPITGNKTVSAKFERHIADTENFCFGRNFLVSFPDLKELPQIAEVDHIIARPIGPSPDPSVIDFEITP